MSSYRTIEGASVAEVVEKKSRFIAQLAHVDDEEAALAFLQSVRTEHAQARHNVYAYVLRGGRVRYSDDGEPPQTSGLPTYETLAHAELVDVICVTTRYFGGTLLGTGGLVRAYTQACQEAIAAAHVAVVSVCRDVSLSVPYDLYQAVLRAAEGPGVAVASTDFAECVRLVFRALDEEAEGLKARLVEATRGKCPIDVGPTYEGAIGCVPTARHAS